MIRSNSRKTARSGGQRLHGKGRPRCGTCQRRLRRITDISSEKPDCLLGSKFSRSGSPLRDEMRQKRGGPRRIIWKASKGVWKPCNPLKSHKTAKDLFGKAWSKTREFWRSLEKGLESAFIPPSLAPPPAASIWFQETKLAHCEFSFSAVAPRLGTVVVGSGPKFGASLSLSQFVWMQR